MVKMRVLFSYLFITSTFCSLYSQHLFVKKPHPKGFIERHHFQHSLNHCKSMCAYNVHRIHKSHVPHVVSVVHMVPSVLGSSESHATASLAEPVPVPIPIPVPELSLEQKQLAAIAANPKTATYKDRISAMKPGDVLELPPINFVYNQDELAVANMESFMQAVEFASNGFMVLVEGHTDDRGSDDYNLKLSMKGVERIKQLMVEMGVSEDFISVVGQGERKPIVPNISEENRLKNRRIEFKVFKL